MKYFYIKLFFSYGLLGLSFLSCSSKLPQYEAHSDDADPSYEITRLSYDLQSAEENQASVFAPESFEDANEELRNADRLRNKGKSNREILDHVARGRAYLKRAQERTNIARAALGPISDARGAALAAGAQRIYPRELKEIDKDLKDRSKDIEGGEVKISSKNMKSLETRYRDLEMMSIKRQHLASAQDALALAEAEGAKKVAPQTYALARQRYTEANALIEKSPRDPASFTAPAELANQEANKLLRITRESKQNAKKSSEQLALEAERLAQLEAQAKAQSAELSAQNQALGTQISRQEASLGAFQNSEEMDRRIAAVREKFDPSEAEVLQSGRDKVIIRLKALAFSSNQATLRTEQLALMAKVEDAVKTLGEGNVTIEGHTDSLGTRAKNKRLSQKRAEAVEEYLVTNGAVERERIKAVGQGFDKPISTNKNAAGRAQNRRVDVIVDF